MTCRKSCGIDTFIEVFGLGGTLELKVIYEAEKPGHFSKSLRVYGNTEDSPLRLSVRGTAK